MTPNSFPLIAGRHAGIRVRCTPQAKPIYDNLVQLSQGGNYWASMIVKGIQGLAAGYLHLNNVFIKKNSAVLQGEFILVLPGCVATLEKRSNGEIHLLHLTADESYFELQQLGQRPGLYQVKKAKEGWKADFIADGKITQGKNGVVAITDRRGTDPDKVADAAAPFILGSPVSDPLAKKVFDMHYTPGTIRIGGWRNLRQALRAQTDASLHESAILLANTMARARNIDGVRWIAEHGGTGVLIQAMRILADQGITLNKHVVFLNHPTTLASQVVSLGQKLGLKPLRKLSQSNPLSPDELVGGLFFGTAGYISAYQRLRQDKKYYDGWKFIGDVVGETTNLKGAAAPAAAVTAALGLSTGIGATPALIVFSSAVLAVKTGRQLTEAWLPRMYHKIKSKF